MNKNILTLVTLASAVIGVLFTMQAAHPKIGEFEKFKLDFGKVYTGAEEEYRRTIFFENLAKIETHNADLTQTHKLGVTQFADLTQDEFVATHLTARLNTKYTRVEYKRTLDSKPVVGDVDWVSQGKVSQVKNQGNCGSCWAFSATGSIESALLLAGRNDLLSEQQLVDCSRSYGNQGCNGGWMDSAFQYARDHGLTSQSAYPYVARDQACQIDSGSVKVTGFVDVPGCDNLVNALNSRPVSVAVDASVWSLYKSGVLTSCGTAINHGVLAVGYTDSFWKIKNSWGTGWGESGFIRIGRGNTCAVCSYPSYPTV